MPTMTICLCRGNDDDGIKGTGIVDHIGLGGEGHDGNGGPRGGDYDVAGDNDTRPSTVEVIIKKISPLLV